MRQMHKYLVDRFDVFFFLLVGASMVLTLLVVAGSWLLMPLIFKLAQG